MKTTEKLAEALRLLEECRSALMESDRDCDYPLIDRIEALAAYTAEQAQAREVEGLTVDEILKLRDENVTINPDNSEHIGFARDVERTLAARWGLKIKEQV